MRSTFQPCLPSTGKVVPATPAWLHEVKFDGYRLIVVCEGDHVRLVTRGGHNWSDRYSWIEGLVSKRADRPYRGGRSKDWVKVKNRKHPARYRVRDRF